MGFLDDLKRRLMQQDGQHPPLVMNDPGISGRDTRPSDVITGIPQQPTPSTAPQVPITRPRAVMDGVRAAVAQPVVQPQQQMPQVSPQVDTQPNFRNDTPEATRDRRTQPRDYIADDTAYLRDVRNRPRNWRDRVVDAIDAVNAGVGGQRRILPTKRERQLGEAENALGQDIKISDARIRSEQGQMVPFQLPDGTWTQIPLKQAATVGSRQQGQQAGLSLRKRQLDEHLGRWQSMTKHEAMGDAQRLYNSGAADDDPDLRDEIVRMMGLPQGTKLPPHTMGQIQTDADGNLVVVDRRKSTATPVTAPNAEGVPTPVTSMQKTTEQGRNRRFQQGIQSREKIATMPSRTSPRTTAAPKPNPAHVKAASDTWKQVSRRNDTINSVNAEIARVNAMSDKDADAAYKGEKDAGWNNNESIKNQKLRQLGESLQNYASQNQRDADSTNMLNSGYEFQVDKQGRVTQVARGASDLDRPIVGTPKQGRTIEGAIQAFQKSQKRAPTADEIARMKAALGQ